jgi:hypothetical protein
MVGHLSRGVCGRVKRICTWEVTLITGWAQYVSPEIAVRTL